MTFWDFFKSQLGSEENNTKYSRLHDRIQTHLPDEMSEEDHVKIACVAELLTRVAYVDMKIDCVEKKSMESVLKKFTDFSKELIQVCVETASDEIKDLAGNENHLYCTPLTKILSTDERYHILESLFAFAASDGIACARESEEIRLISKSLLLEHRHFISARATVLESLGALKD